MNADIVAHTAEQLRSHADQLWTDLVDTASRHTPEELVAQQDTIIGAGKKADTSTPQGIILKNICWLAHVALLEVHSKLIERHDLSKELEG